MQDNKVEALYQLLEEYGQSSIYPAHMPGHKRRKAGVMPEAFTRADITEVEGFDNLAHPGGILKKMQEKAAALYGAEESFYLVNGSTGGILSGVSAAVPIGGHLLMARGCHQSVYHAAYLRQLRLSYLYPDQIPGFSISQDITVQQVRQALEQYKDVSAVLIVSPTYEGRISDVSAIAEEVHKWGIPLLVDEAHGAHLGFAEEFSENSCRQGVDLVVHSVHKTLPALTQSALLHVNGSLIDRNLLRRFLHIYQTTSPSYLLMSGIDNALQLMEREGRERGKQFFVYWDTMLRTLSKMKRLEILPFPDKKQDIGKLAVFTRKINLSPRQLYDMLLREYHIQVEMVGIDYILAMFTVWDEAEGFHRMTEALLAIDEKIESVAEARESILCTSLHADRQSTSYTDKNTVSEFVVNTDRNLVDQTVVALPLWEAWDAPWRECLLEEAEGQIGVEFIGFYPPGIPLLVPGERFSSPLIAYMQDAIRRRETLEGISQEIGDGGHVQPPTVHVLLERV